MAIGEPLQQRLVLCLDGTWNQRDSGTNIYHLSNLIQKGVVEDGWRQRIYYDPGVGTGMLDSITGGAFGIGLSRNVREAYDWLGDRYPNYTNLWRYLTDRNTTVPAPPVHRYTEEGWRWWACLVGWLALIALAGWQLGDWLGGAWRWLGLAAPVLALLVDWRKSVLNHQRPSNRMG